MERYPARPYAPPLLMGLTVLVVGSNLALWGVAEPLVLMVVGLAVGAFAVVFLARDKRAVAAMLFAAAMALALASAQCSLALQGLDAAAEELSHTPVSKVWLQVSSDPTESQSGWLCRAVATLPSGTKVRAWLTTSQRYEAGESVRAIGRFSANSDDDWGRSSRAAGLAGRVRAVSVVEENEPQGMLSMVASLRGWAVDAVGPSESSEGALLAGLVAGERSELKAQGLSNLFASAGLAHLVAVSGAHLSVFASVAESLLLAAAAGRKARTPLTLGLCGLFVVFCGCPASAVRAWVMLASSMGARAVGRRGHAPSGLALAGIAMCVADPFCACDLGFQLSVISVASLTLFSGYADGLVGALLGKPGLFGRLRLPARARAALSHVARYVRSSVCSSLVVQLATWPLVVSAFGRISLISPVSNIVVGPLFAPLLFLGLAGVCLSGLPFVGGCVLGAAKLLARLVIWLVGLLASLPFASVAALAPEWSKLVPIALGVLLLVLWPRPSSKALRLFAAGAASILVVIVLRLVVFVPASVTVLDVGQGDAILIREGPHALLVDTGPGDAIVAAMARQHVFLLDAVVVTHLHDDHTGGIDDLAGLVPCGEVLVGSGVSSDLGTLSGEVASLARFGVGELQDGDVIRLGGFTLTCLWPDASSDGSENEDSVCLLLEYEGIDGTMSMLLTGDAEQDVLQTVAPRAGDVDVLKVGHHGSRVSIDEGEAAVLRPEVSVASAGEGNSYGHPTPECVEVLEDAGSLFLCTKDRGDVTLYPSADGVRVACER